MYEIRINNNPRNLVHKKETISNLKAVNAGRKWAGKWYGCVTTKCTTFATREEAEAIVKVLESFKNLGHCFSKEITYNIVEI